MSVDEVQFGFMPKSETIDTMLSCEGCKKSIMIKEKSCTCVLLT